MFQCFCNTNAYLKPINPILKKKPSIQKLSFETRELQPPKLNTSITTTRGPKPHYTQREQKTRKQLS